MAVLGSRKWAIILCEFAGTSQGPAASRDVCERLFLREGESGIFDYWKDLSGGAFDLEGSQVLGPFTLSYTLAEAQASATAQNAATSRHGRIFRVQDVVDDLADRIDFAGVQGVVVIVNENFDVGATGTTLPDGQGVPATIFEPKSFQQNAMGHLFAHETAHMLGLNHSMRLGAKEEWAQEGKTGNGWKYSDGWCISGGIRDDLSDADCRFNIDNPTLMNARSGPAIKGQYLRDLGWLTSGSVFTYRSHAAHAQTLAGLYPTRADGVRMIQTTRTRTGSARYQIELRLKEGWDQGIPRHAFLVRKLEDDGTAQLVVKSRTQNDWGVGDRFESTTDGIGIDFEGIDPAAGTGAVRLTRLVGKTADALVGGGWGMLALQRGTGVPFRYLGRPGQWLQVGDPAAQFAISGNALYGLAGDREKIWKYTGRENRWVQVGESADAIIAGGWGLIALQRGTGIPFQHRGQRRWRKVGGPAAQFVISNDGLYGLASDREKIWRYTGRGESWEQVGQSADALVAGGAGMLALQRNTGVPFLFQGRPGQWRKIGAPAAQFCFSKNALYGLASDRRAIWRYSGEGEDWYRVGGAAHSITAGGTTLFSLSPDRNSITRY